MSENAEPVHVRLTIGSNSLEVYVLPRQVSTLIDRWFAATGIASDPAIQAQVEKLKQSASTLQSAVDANTPKPTQE